MKSILIKTSIIAALLLFSACGPRVRQEAASESKAEISDMGMRLDRQRASSAASDRRGTGDDGVPVRSLAGAALNRLRVMTGSMTFIVQDVKGAERALAEAVNRHSGYIALSRIESGTATVTIKIPADAFDMFVSDMEKMMTLARKEITVEDVTEEFIDLDVRIKNKRILLSRYQDYLRRAASVKELIDLEQAINSVTTEIESLEGSFKGLKHAIAYSTLTLILEPTPEQKTKPAAPSFAAGFAILRDFIVTFLYYFVFAVMYLLVVLVPLTLLVGFVYWIGFGRVGLVLKLFRRLGRKSPTP